MRVLINEICVGNKDYFTLDGAIMERSAARIVCYRQDERLTSFTFTIYDDTYVETEQKDLIEYYKQIQSLRAITPEIRPYELRTLCGIGSVYIKKLLTLFEQVYSEGVRIAPTQCLINGVTLWYGCIKVSIITMR